MHHVNRRGKKGTDMRYDTKEVVQRLNEKKNKKTKQE